MGQRDVSFTTPEANMSLKSNQRTSQKVTPSCALTPRDPRINVSGATRMQRNPTSRSKLSLDSDKWTGNNEMNGKSDKKDREDKGSRVAILVYLCLQCCCTAAGTNSGLRMTSTYQQTAKTILRSFNQLLLITVLC